MSISKLYKKGGLLCIALATVALSSCEYDGNPNDLDEVNPADFEGKVDGYNSSEEIFPQNLVAYWSFDDTKNELKSGTAPTSSLNDTYVADGVRNKALELNGGWVYYATQFEAFKTSKLKSFTISEWVQVQNNGSKRTMAFQLARPGMFNGNINLALNTNLAPATNANILRIQPTFMTATGGMQDNLNNVLSPNNTPGKWTHIVLTYDHTTGVFNIWADAVKVGNFPNRGLVNTFFSHEPSEVIIGANYNSIPGKSVNTDTNFAPMTGKIDEIRVYDRVLPDAHIRSLYNLGVANK